MLIRRNSVRLQLLTAVSKKIILFEDMTTCGILQS